MIERILGRFWRSRLFPAAFYLVLALIVTWPLAAKLGSTILGPAGDNIYYVWLLGWFRKALFELHINPLVVPFHNYPYGWPLAYSEITLANVALGLPFALAGGNIFGYNAVILISYVLSGYFVFLWVHDLTCRRDAALLAGALFAFCAYRSAHVMGHWPLMGTQWLALFMLGLHLLLVRGEISIRSVAATAGGFGLAALSSMYYLYMGAIAGGLTILIYLGVGNWKQLRQAAFWKGLAFSGLAAVPPVLLAVVPYLQIARSGDANHRALEVVDNFSASLTDFVLPNSNHSLWGSLFPLPFNFAYFIEHYIYLGVVTLVLLAVGLASLRHSGTQRKFTLWLMLSLLADVLLAMGTTLHWMGQPVRLSPVPDLLKHWFITSQGLIPLPNYFLYKYLPFYDGMRVWARYGIFAALFGAALAGMGYAAIAARLNRIVVGVLLAMCLLIAGIDLHVGYDFFTLQPSPVDQWLAAQPDGGAVAQFPIADAYNSRTIYGSLTYNRPLLGMFYGAYFPANFQAILPALEQFPDVESLAILRQRRIETLVVDSAKYLDWSSTRQTLLGLRVEEVAQVGTVIIFRVLP